MKKTLGENSSQNSDGMWRICELNKEILTLIRRSGKSVMTNFGLLLEIQMQSSNTNENATTKEVEDQNSWFGNPEDANNKVVVRKKVNKSTSEGPRATLFDPDE